MRIYPNGRKSFVLSYRCNGRKRLMTLGRHGVITLDEARTLARKALVDVAAEKDPLDQRQLANQGESVADLCDAFLERYSKIHKRSWKDDASRIRLYIIPAWGALRASSLKRSDVARLHRQLGEKHPYGANRLLELLSKMYELARVWGVVEEDYTNPARGIPKFREEKRDRWITPEELPRLAKAIDEEPNRPARAALWLYLLTGLRKSELLSLRWSDIDDHRQEIRLGRTKSGRSHYVPLSEAARKILQEIPRLEDNAYVFPGAKPGHHLVNIDKPWRRVRQSAGIEDVRLHDLRRTMGSWLAQAGNSLHLIGRVLNHSTPSTTQVYARFGNDHVRSALESYGKQLMGVAGRTPRAPVISYTEKLDYAAVSMEPKKPAVGD
jgi:integrase